MAALNRIFFLLSTVLLLRAGPALSVPITSPVDPQTAAQNGSGDAATHEDGQWNQKVDADGEPVAGIVDYDPLAYGPQSETQAPHASYATAGKVTTEHSGGMGWMKPVAAIGAGGALAFALSHGGGSSENSTAAASLMGAGNPASPGGSGGTSSGGGGGGGAVNTPEPGTIALLGLGVASMLGRRKLMRKK